MSKIKLDRILLSGNLTFPLEDAPETHQCIEDWIIEYGSTYLRKLYQNFPFYYAVFLREFFAVYALDGWTLHDYGLSRINLPSEAQLEKFINASKIVKNIRPFCYGTPILYRGAAYLYLGYQICFNLILAKRIKDI